MNKYAQLLLQKIRNEIRKIFKSRYTAVEHIAYSENL